MKLKLVLTILLTLTNTACTPLIVNTIGRVYDNNDGCQQRNWQDNRAPSYCGAGSSRTYIYATPHQSPIGTQSGYIK